MLSKSILVCFALAAMSLVSVQASDKGDKIIILPQKPKQQYYPIPIYYPTYSHYGGHDSGYSMGGYGGDDHSSYGGGYDGGYGHMMSGGMGGY